jgi:hypothetical protein
MADKPKKLTAQLTPTDDKKRPEVKVKVPKTENIIFIGSEMYYDSFWLKMMFISAAYVKARTLRKANKQTIAYVDVGYTRIEKLTLEYLQDKMKFELVKLNDSDAVIDLMNRDRDRYKLLDVAFFSHGVVGQIALNYPSQAQIVNFETDNFSDVEKTAFAANGRIYSYACRTGVGKDDKQSGFKNESEAQLEKSLAQDLANHFNIEVHAYLKRTFYGDVIRNKSNSETITSTLKKERQTQEGDLIQIPPDHEALPHPDLANGWNPLSGAKREGTYNYALWRKDGGLKLPVAADSPKGLPNDMRIFKPKK